ncbi:MAG: extracellular solute-binding protein [Candidatus Daviesbacteria bacterium]|nr:extracellular solute-binding protein [Candidatus Daviesbacteria bacterium]
MKIAGLSVLIFSVILGIVFWSFGSQIFNLSAPDQDIELTYWSVDEDERVMKAIITSYLSSRPKIKINFVKQSRINYRTRLQTQLRAGSGPDIFRFHHSWLSSFSSDLQPAPTSLISAEEFEKTFYPLVSERLVVNKRIYGIPLEIDGIAMLVNTDILKAAAVETPSDWQQFVVATRKVTVRNTAGQIQTAGAAIGSTSNIDYWPEILATLFFQQPSTSLGDPAVGGGAEALTFYTSFILDPRNKVWDTTLAPAAQMFKEGRLAFYFAPYKIAAQIKRENPTLNFGVYAIPQLPGGQISYGSFWAEGVSSKSLHQKEAWEFLTYLATKPVLEFRANSYAQIGAEIRLSPRIDMASLYLFDPLATTYIKTAPNFKSWYLNSDVADSGINDELIAIYKQTVDKTLQGQESELSLQDISGEVKQILSKHQVIE